MASQAAPLPPSTSFTPSALLRSGLSGETQPSARNVRAHEYFSVFDLSNPPPDPDLHLMCAHSCAFKPPVQIAAQELHHPSLHVGAQDVWHNISSSLEPPSKRARRCSHTVPKARVFLCNVFLTVVLRPHFILHMERSPADPPHRLLLSFRGVGGQ